MCVDGVGEVPRESGGAEAGSCEDEALEAGGPDMRRAMEEAPGKPELAAQGRVESSWPRGDQA